MVSQQIKRRHSTSACLASVLARLSVLKSYLSETAITDQRVVDACKSQAALADLDIPALGITPVSRNSMYKFADFACKENPSLLNGFNGSGRQFLDHLRQHVCSLKVVTTKARSKAALLQRSEDVCLQLRELLSASEAHSLRLSKAYHHMLQKIAALSKVDLGSAEMRTRLISILRDQNFLYEDLFSEVDIQRTSKVEDFNEKQRLV